jgi:hypothetical protein
MSKLNWDGYCEARTRRVFSLSVLDVLSDVPGLCRRKKAAKKADGLNVRLFDVFLVPDHIDVIDHSTNATSGSDVCI